MNGCLIYHETDGIYLGNCLGMGFWSKLDPVGQDSAPVFPTEAIAEEHIREIAQYASHLQSCKVVPVKADLDGGQYASIQACIKAGLPGWDPDGRLMEVKS